MNAAYVHLSLNHVPILGTVFGLVLLAVAVLRANETLRRAGWVTLVVVALAAIPVYLTGEGAEEVVEGEPGVSHDAIEAHEEAALPALVALEAAGLLALWALFASWRRTAPTWVAPLSLLLAAVAAGLLGWTAERGGRINHPEAHRDAAAAEHRGVP
jgi:uncharacterized membrane protein